MKKIITLVIFVSAVPLFSQNLQIHYDMGKDRKYVTTTLEMFKPDEYGATFFFVDMDYNNPGNNSMSMGYWEIARYIDLPVIKGLSATVQYNDGILAYPGKENQLYAVPLGHAWLTGLTYPIDLKIITLNTELLYRYAWGSDAPDMQVTFVWFKSLFNNRINFTGYCDIWTQDNFSGEKQNIVQTEPQLWYIVNKHLGLGGEVEISKNFLPYDGWQFMPTLGMKWEF